MSDYQRVVHCRRGGVLARKR